MSESYPRALEHSLNEALVEADISCGYERFLSIFDRFYCDDIAVWSEAQPALLRGKEQVRPLLLKFLVPLQLSAELGGLSVSCQYFEVTGTASDERQTNWIVTVEDALKRSSVLTWTSVRGWRGVQVMYERHFDIRCAGEAIIPLAQNLSE